MSEAAVYARATAHAGLAALVGTRVYPSNLPQSPTLPAVAYTRISRSRESVMGIDTDLARGRYQLTVFAPTYLVAKLVLEQIRAAFQRYRGTSAGVVVDETFIENDRDGYDPTLGLHAPSIDILMHYRET